MPYPLNYLPHRHLKFQHEYQEQPEGIRHRLVAVAGPDRIEGPLVKFGEIAFLLDFTIDGGASKGGYFATTSAHEEGSLPAIGRFDALPLVETVLSLTEKI